MPSTRRDFLKKLGIGAGVAATVALPQMPSAEMAAPPEVDNEPLILVSGQRLISPTFMASGCVDMRMWSASSPVRHTSDPF